jgi:hypothetical protein
MIRYRETEGKEDPMERLDGKMALVAARLRDA